MTTSPGMPGPGAHAYPDRDAEKIDLLKKIAGLLTALTLLALVSVILQVVGLVRGEQRAEQIQQRLEEIRDDRVVVDSTP